MAIIYLFGFLTAVGGSVSPEPRAPADAAGAFAARATGEEVLGTPSHLAIPRSSDGLFYVNGSSDSGTVRFLVDTGATHVILSHADAATVSSHALTESKGSITTAAGTVRVRWVAIDRLRIAGHDLRDVKAAVPENDAGLSLLGQNALAQFKQLRIDTDRLVLSR